MSASGLVLRISGKVQGVGFRPFVWQLAQKYRLRGEVLNDSAGVEIRLRQPLDSDALVADLYRLCPPLAHIDTIVSLPFNWLHLPHDFTIVHSQHSEMQTQIIPDAATCPDCLLEMNTPSDSRYRYPFINCTHCGPRFTLIREMPYDRVNTAMSPFTLCAPCQQQYENPDDRRFHAQPVCCPQCGPQLFSCQRDGQPQAQGEAALQQAIAALCQGQIVAIKGLGGYHLACDATNAQAVQHLRERKQRPGKPLAVMLPDDSWLTRCSRETMTPKLTTLLHSPAAPIVLLGKLSTSPLCDEIAPGLDEVGLMLAANPLQHLLMQGVARPLVMTSGNAAGCAPALTNQQALEQLQEIADLWLMHDRDILQRADDSLLRLNEYGSEMLRRARGYVPDALPLPPGFSAPKPLLALGGDLKNTFCLLRGKEAILSQHFGSLPQLDIQQQWQESIQHFIHVYDCQPQQVVCDAHPGYVSHQWAHQQPHPVTEVLHHHAHIAACLGEHRWPLDGGAVIGITLDGIGYGAGGAMWGGECLLADYRDCQHLGGLPGVALPGGDKAAHQPWRNLLAQWQRFMPQWPQSTLASRLADKPWQPLSIAIEKGLNAPLASSCGRLFDAIAAATGCAPEQQRFEGEAACLLEVLASAAQGSQHPLTMPLISSESGWQLDLASFWQQWFHWQASPAQQAWAFHDALAQGFATLATHAATQHQINTLVLCGGVLHNRLLRQRLTHYLAEFNVLTPHMLPAGDGGLAFGQALIACAR